MDIKGKITGIKYKVLLSDEIQSVDIDKFNINKNSSFCLLKDKKNSYAISKWVSPKRTRSYPYERIYNTLNISKKITVIPIIKDEGSDGDRDFLQWDTVSLMSLLDVFVIFAYYDKAERNPNYKNKITDFQFDNEYVISKVKEIEQYHSSALHWNLKELKDNLHNIIDEIKKNYVKIEKYTGVTLHNQSGIDNFKKKIGKDVKILCNFREKKPQKHNQKKVYQLFQKLKLQLLTILVVNISLQSMKL